MSEWKDSDEWSYWLCATCGVEMFDPDTISVTSCANGHTNYLGPVRGKRGDWRTAYPTPQARSKDIREHNALVKMMDDAIIAGRKTIKKSGREPRL